MLSKGVRRSVFSSTCVTYGSPALVPTTEIASNRLPIRTAGRSCARNACGSLDYAASREEFALAALRYFKVPASSVHGSVGEEPLARNSSHTGAPADQTGAARKVTIFGEDDPSDDELTAAARSVIVEFRVDSGPDDQAVRQCLTRIRAKFGANSAGRHGAGIRGMIESAWCWFEKQPNHKRARRQPRVKSV
jgi:hypothetical protein